MVRPITETFRPFGGSAEGRFVERENNYLEPENPKTAGEFWDALKKRFHADVFFSRFGLVVGLNLAGDLFGALGHRSAGLLRLGTRGQLLAPILFDEGGTALFTARNREGGWSFGNLGLDLFEAAIQRSVMHPALKLLPQLDLTQLTRRGRIGWKAANILFMGGAILVGSILARVASHIAFSQKDNPLAKTKYGLALEAVDMVLAAGQSRVRHPVTRALAARAARRAATPAAVSVAPAAVSATPAVSAGAAAAPGAVPATQAAAAAQPAAPARAATATPAPAPGASATPASRTLIDVSALNSLELAEVIRTKDPVNQPAAYDRLHALAVSNDPNAWPVLTQLGTKDRRVIFILKEIASHLEPKACMALADIAKMGGAQNQNLAAATLKDLALSNAMNSYAVTALGEVAATEVIARAFLKELVRAENPFAPKVLVEAATQSPVLRAHVRELIAWEGNVATSEALLLKALEDRTMMDALRGLIAEARDSKKARLCTALCETDPYPLFLAEHNDQNTLILGQLAILGNRSARKYAEKRLAELKTLANGGDGEAQKIVAMLEKRGEPS